MGNINWWDGFSLARCNVETKNRWSWRDIVAKCRPGDVIEWWWWWSSSKCNILNSDQRAPLSWFFVSPRKKPAHAHNSISAILSLNLKMSYEAGKYPREYNPKVHGPYHPGRYYGKRKWNTSAHLCNKILWKYYKQNQITSDVLKAGGQTWSKDSSSSSVYT